MITWIDEAFQTCLSIGKILIQSKLFLRPLPKHSGSCIILANGPSANVTLENNYEQLRKMDIFCVNLFGSTPHYEALKPVGYILLDPNLLTMNRPDLVILYNDLVAKTTWPIDLIVPISFKKSAEFLEKMQQNPNIQLRFYNYTLIKGFDFFEKLALKKGWGMFQSQNVLVAAIQLCIRMNYKKIYITGADHSWHETIRVSDEDNSLLLHDTHFYGNQQRNLSEEYKTNEQTKITSELANQFQALLKIFTGHQRVANYAAHKKVELINISQHSNIDVYKRGHLPMEK